MVSFNTGSAASFAYNRIDGVPTAISGTVMTQYAEQVVYELGNYVMSEIDPSSFDQAYFPFVVEMTVAMTLARMHGAGVKYNWNLGEFSVTKGSSSSTEALQIELALMKAKRELDNIQRPNPVAMSYYG